jgi:uncharacterized membrane protein YqhA
MNLIASVLTNSRYFILIAVFGSLLASFAAILYSSLIALGAFIEAFGALIDGGATEGGSHHLAVSVINSVDIMLLGTVLYLIAFGMYELFINPTLVLPRWMHVTDIEKLKVRLLSVVVVMIAVNFLAYLVEWNGSSDILAVGLAVGAVFAGLGVLLYATSRGHHKSGEEQAD